MNEGTVGQKQTKLATTFLQEGGENNSGACSCLELDTYAGGK